MSGTTIESATEIRPFQVEVPEEELAELRRRVATRWPEKETVADQTQGVRLATIQCRQCLPERALSGSSELDREGLPQPHLLQRGRRRQPLRGLARAGPLHDRGPGRVQVPALIGARGRPAGTVPRVTAAR